ncbi:MAG: family 16 glycoside hydrolase [Aggregatilineales bacterium]
MLAVENQFNVYINNKLVWQFSDDKNSEGTISLVGMNALADDDSSCSFSDTWLRDLRDVDDITPRMPLALPPTTIASLASIGLVPNDGELDTYIPRNVLEMNADKSSDSVYLEQEYDNFVFGTTFMYAGAAGGNTEHMCRVDFRLTPNNNYRLQLNRNGEMKLSPTIDGNQLDTLENRSESSANLRVADSQANDLAIVAYNDELRVYVNHLLVGDFEDSQLSDGIIRLIGNTSGETDAGCTFMDSRVWTLNNAAAPLSDLISLPDTPEIETVAIASIPTETPTLMPTDIPPPTAAPTDVPPPTTVPTDTSLIPDVVHTSTDSWVWVTQLEVISANRSHEQ